MWLVALVTVVLLGTTAFGERGIHLGCYGDYHSPRDLPHGYWGDTTGMTITKCIGHCSALNWAYAGLQDGFECWCGNSYGSYNKAFNCDAPCVGDISTTCGGSYANNIYTAKSDPEATPCTPVDCSVASWTPFGECKGECGTNNGQKVRTREVKTPAWCGGRVCPNLRDSDTCTREEPCRPDHDLQYLGCWNDDPADRVLPDDEIEGHELTLEICAEHCNARGRMYAGVQNGVECWCGSGDYTRHGYTKYCNIPCAGNNIQFCGGGNALSVFNSSWSECEPIDCEMGEWTEWQECFGECGEGEGRQHRYRNITQEQECGGHSCPSFVDERPCDAIRFYCPGENYVGCFNDTHDRDLPEDHYEDPANTVDKCIIHCRSFGWQYAGVNLEECWCGDAYGRYGAGRGCGYRCPGDPSVGCGGYWQNSVYNTSYMTQTEKDMTTTACGAPQDCQLSNYTAWEPCDLQCIRTRSAEVIQYPKCGGEECPYSTRDSRNCDRDDVGCRAIDQMIVGCYRDGEDRDLTYGPVESLYMNPGMCIYHCREKGFLYAGLQGGYQCFCGDTYGKYDISYMCNAPCWGDQKSFCGGGWANSIYRTAGIIMPTTTGGPCVPEDCVPGEWGAWSKCEGECGEGKGTRLRFRPVIKPERCGGKPCIVAEGQTCTRPDCPMAITENDSGDNVNDLMLESALNKAHKVKRSVDNAEGTEVKNDLTVPSYAVAAMATVGVVVLVIVVAIVVQVRKKP